ncbi:MAG: leucine-rich repeat protein [Paludibacteraceae bacterium]|nr:leucine-rich repeat protein [Paludibacteraceae bacterium]MBN2786900.1 leucine-rich repeat protein [Paludibacteraceae bacterium]
MKKTFLLILCLCITMMSQALTVVSTAGGLSSAITTAGKTLSTVDSLTVTGTIDARDFYIIRENMPALIKLDLSLTTISAYVGIGGTITGTNSYDANAIPKNAFSDPQAYTGKKDMTSIILPNSITYIGERAFQNCIGLSSIDIPSSVISIGTYAFSFCNGLTSVSIPSSVSVIGNGAFACCSKITSLYLPSSVLSIGDGAFSNCWKLTSINIPSSITSIGNEVFNNCFVLDSISIPSSVTSIGSSAFSGCNGLSSINIPSSVTSIGSSAFYNCDGLTSISIPSSITSIENFTFSYCKSLTSVTIPSSVTSIGNQAFNECTELTTINIPSSVTNIGSWAFYKCQKLTFATTPFAKDIFWDSPILTSITISNGLKSIKDESFSGLNTVTSIEIPSSVDTIGGYAFRDCYQLTSIKANNPIPVDLASSWKVFYNINKTTCILHVPVGSKILYETANQWKDFLNIVEDLPNAVKNATSTKFKVITQNNQAIISGIPIGEIIIIYNLQGTAIYNQQANAESVIVNLPAPGVYVVKVGLQSLKVIN